MTGLSSSQEKAKILETQYLNLGNLEARVCVPPALPGKRSHYFVRTLFKVRFFDASKTVTSATPQKNSLESVHSTPQKYSNPTPAEYLPDQ